MSCLIRRGCPLFLIVLLLVTLTGSPAAGEHETVKIGVLANPAFYAELETHHRAQRIATLKNIVTNDVSTSFGAAIFHRADRSDIQHLSDLRGKTLAAVDENSLGGWLAAWYELKQQGIDPHRYFADLQFAGTHDAVVYAVRDGLVDAGTVRTDTLERMAAEGKIRLDDFHVIHEHVLEDEEPPYLHSTRLYPEWPFARAAHRSDELAEKVAVALLSMSPEDPAAKAARCAGWTIPLNYRPVRECLQALRVAPYEDFGKVTFAALLQQHRGSVVTGAIAFVLITCALAWVVRLNAGLHRVSADLENELTQRKQAEAELRRSNEELERFNRLAVGREHRMIELKQQIDDLAVRLGDEPPYAHSLHQHDGGEGRADDDA